MAKKSKQIVKQVEAKKPVFKSRFSGLVKIASDANLPAIEMKVIEGNEYFEFVGLKGVYFSAKMFV